MRRLRLCFAVCLLTIGTITFGSDITTSLTGLAVFQYSEFQGVAPGIYTLFSFDDLFVKNDYLKSDPAFYYLGIGYITDITVQYGHKFHLGRLSVIPAGGIGTNFGYLNESLYQLYIPISLTVKFSVGRNIDLTVWGQIQNYILNQDTIFYSIGGKIAVDINIRFDNWGIAISPICGGGSGQFLAGLKLGTIFYLNEKQRYRIL